MMNKITTCVCLLGMFCSIVCFVGAEDTKLSEEKKLINELLAKYKRVGIMGRPVQNSSEKMVISFGIALIQILELDQKNQLLSVNVWSRYSWTDKLLSWEPSDYGNVKEVRLPSDSIWTPDVVLYNYADERMKVQRDVMVVVNYQGQTQWIPPAIYKSTCIIDIRTFPFDYQVCILKFGSWSYNINKLDLQFYGNQNFTDDAHYQPNNEWEIIDRPAIREEKVSADGVDTFVHLIFFLFLKRNPEFFAYLLVLPCILLSSLTLSIFWLPPNTPAKMVLGMNIFVGFFWLMLLLDGSTPSASTSIPYIGYFYCLNMAIITMSSFLSVIVINLHFRSTSRNKLPDWLRKLTLFLSNLFGMQIDLISNPKEKLPVIKPEIPNSHGATGEINKTSLQLSHRPSNLHPLRSDSVSQTSKALSVSHPCRLSGGIAVEMRRINCRIQEENMQQCNVEEQESPTLPVPIVFADFHDDNAPEFGAFNNSMFAHDNYCSHLFSHEPLKQDLHEISKAVRNLMNRLSDKDKKNKLAQEWRMVALVLDRFYFWLYLVISIAAGLIFLIPNNQTKTIAEVLQQYQPKNT